MPVNHFDSFLYILDVWLTGSCAPRPLFINDLIVIKYVHSLPTCIPK